MVVRASAILASTMRKVVIAIHVTGLQIAWLVVCAMRPRRYDRMPEIRRIPQLPLQRETDKVSLMPTPGSG